MAKKGSSKWFSEIHEERIAMVYDGKRSVSSGAAVHDQGDVRTSDQLIECKHTGSFVKPAKSISIKLADLEKIMEEAYSEGKLPMMALSLYAPDSKYANTQGCVDLIVRLMYDDVQLRSDSDV